jgi:transketolase
VPTLLRRIGLADVYLQGASKAYLMRRYGIDATSLVATIEEALGQRLAIDAAELVDVRVDSFASEGQQEAL